MYYLLMHQSRRVMVMRFNSDKERMAFVKRNADTELILVDESNEYVKEALKLEEDFPVILYL